MSILKLSDCFARPPEEEKENHYLLSHLNQVASTTGKFLTTKSDKLLFELLHLAGLLHDIGKSHVYWQSYIRGEKNKGPTHAAFGAFLFSYYAHHFLKDVNKWDSYKKQWFWIAQDIADHHGRLKSLSFNQVDWQREYSWDKYPLEEIHQWLKARFSAFRKIDNIRERLDDWIDDLDEILEDELMYEEFVSDDYSYEELMDFLQEWRMYTTSLIASDRFSLQTDFQNVSFNSKDFEELNIHIQSFCKKQIGTMSEERQRAQQEVMKTLEEYRNEKFFTLDMPTGYGKTLTAFRMAARIGELEGMRKIIYVAPYLSIIEQSAKVFEEVTGHHVLEHHSQALTDDKFSENRGENKNERPPQLIMEAWAHPIVCTSFQQFMKAIFPRRAQETLRRAYLHKAIVIIDEPQIFDPKVWNLFLVGIESLLKMYDLKVIFLSATMPPFENGLKKDPVLLKVTPTATHKNNSRYVIQQIDSLSEDLLARRLSERTEKRKATILNTIYDATKTFQLYEKEQEESLFLLHGLMIPVHKRALLNKIQTKLKENEQVTVISTQVLEAGVDVSFEYLYRALPILPSLIQASGRVNRHQETECGIIETSLFLREGEVDTRRFVYREKNLLKITDELLEDRGIIRESETELLVRNYYERMFKENSYEQVKQFIREAFKGRWEAVSQCEPFETDYFRLPIFVPWDFETMEETYLPPLLLDLMNRFSLSNADHIYEMYQYYRPENYEDRKAFMTLFNMFVLQLPVKKALQAASKEDFLEQKIPYMYSDDYDSELGWRDIDNNYDNIF